MHFMLLTILFVSLKFDFCMKVKGEEVAALSRQNANLMDDYREAYFNSLFPNTYLLVNAQSQYCWCYSQTDDTVRRNAQKEKQP